jgi:hypothetical protein
MPTVYPVSIDTEENCENEAVRSIEVTLGSNPQSSYATVSARIDHIDTMLDASLFRMQDYATPQSAIDAAALAGGGIVIVPWGVTNLSLDATTRRFLTLKPNVSLIGHGPKSVLRVPDGAGNYCAIIGTSSSDTCDDLAVCSLTIDGNQSGNGPSSIDDFEPVGGSFSAPRMAINLLGSGKRPTVSDVHIVNHDSINAIWSGLDDTCVSGCRIDAISTFSHDHASIYTHCTGQRIIANIVDGNSVMRSALETHGNEQLVAWNTVRRVKKGMSLTGVSPHGSFGATIVGNQFIDVEAGVNIWAQTYPGGDTIQAFRALIIDQNIVCLNKTMWPEASLSSGICLYAIGQQPLDAPQGNNIVQLV